VSLSDRFSETGNGNTDASMPPLKQGISDYHVQMYEVCDDVCCTRLGAFSYLPPFAETFPVTETKSIDLEMADWQDFLT